MSREGDYYTLSFMDERPDSHTVPLRTSNPPHSHLSVYLPHPSPGTGTSYRPSTHLRSRCPWEFCSNPDPDRVLHEPRRHTLPKDSYLLPVFRPRSRGWILYVVTRPPRAGVGRRLYGSVPVTRLPRRHDPGRHSSLWPSYRRRNEVSGTPYRGPLGVFVDLSPGCLSGLRDVTLPSLSVTNRVSSDSVVCLVPFPTNALVLYIVGHRCPHKCLDDDTNSSNNYSIVSLQKYLTPG